MPDVAPEQRARSARLAAAAALTLCVPAGTRDHFALDLGLDRRDVTGALDAFAAGFERSVDLAAVNGRVFVNNASLGVHAGVVRSKGYREAKLRAWRRPLPDVLAPGGSPAPDLDAPGERLPRDVGLLIVSNNAYRVAPFGGAGTRARLDGGRLGVLAVRLRDPGAVARIVTLAALARPAGLGDLRAWEAETVRGPLGGPGPRRHRQDSSGPRRMRQGGHPMASSSPGTERGLMRVRVLVVDDHELFRQTARRVLAGSVFDVVGEAASGAEALTRVDELAPDLVLLDVQLPDADGFRIAEVVSRRPDPPVVVLVSSRAGSDYGSLVTRSPARAFLPKADLTADALHHALRADGQVT